MPKAAAKSATKARKATAPAKNAKPKKEKSTEPKRAMSAYLFFCADKREELKASGLKSPEIMKALGEAWKKLSAVQVKPYDAKHEEDKARETRERAALGLEPRPPSKPKKTKTTKAGQSSSSSPVPDAEDDESSD
ncbi:hypothetical protein BKA62DRAFT_696155 [Auriculariales sp. MPI-PUGE-AT-0066]|nr:hypothetical protein BKA62DRAFT_696155 [Auriculariales sp. MPI-PUGE-AT-0066]